MGNVYFCELKFVKRLKKKEIMEKLNEKYQSVEVSNTSDKQHSKTWLAMQKYKGTVTVYDKSLFY